MCPLMSVHSDGRTSFCTLLKPLQSSSPYLAGVNVEAAPALAGSVACAGKPLSPARPSISAAVPNIRNEIFALDPGTCNRPLNLGYVRIRSVLGQEAS